MKKIVILLFSSFVLFTVTCSRTAPTISYGFIELVYFQNNGTTQEYFSFFIIPDDEDGIENLADLYLYHDREQLRWHLSSDDWVTYVENRNTWIGSRSIAVSDNERLPRGQYRAVLVNKGGERSERIFTFDAPENPVYPFPSLQIRDLQYTIVSSYPENKLVLYNEEGNHVHTLVLNSLRGSVESLEIPSSARSAALWAQDTMRFTSAFTDVTALYQ